MQSPKISSDMQTTPEGNELRTAGWHVEKEWKQFYFIRLARDLQGTESLPRIPRTFPRLFLPALTKGLLGKPQIMCHYS